MLNCSLNQMEILTVKRMIEQGACDDAISQLDVMIQHSPRNDELFYVRGNAKRKLGLWSEAICDYLAAAKINPESPAAEAAVILRDILEFHNKDLYNQ